MGDLGEDESLHRLANSAVNLVLGFEFNQPPGCGALVAAVESVFEPLASSPHDLVANLHQAKGVATTSASVLQHLSGLAGSCQPGVASAIA